MVKLTRTDKLLFFGLGLIAVFGISSLSKKRELSSYIQCFKTEESSPLIGSIPSLDDYYKKGEIAVSFRPYVKEKEIDDFLVGIGHNKKAKLYDSSYKDFIIEAPYGDEISTIKRFNRDCLRNLIAHVGLSYK
ncbi:hypothetical protein HYX19_01070 [Candidatus Woesearchaeota archaeon]|nr:hypothetical protein [Candidatus Woesearchaeota archaeon]